jgi:DNA-binding response OmpR family regulator
MSREMRMERRVLLVEDNYADVLLLREALQATRHKVTLSIVTDGREALDFLKRRGSYAAAAPPDLVILDLGLRKMGGKETLQEIRKDPELCSLPVVIFTGSSASSDIVDTYCLHASGYIVKPVDMDELGRKVDTLLAYWFDTVELPQNGRNGAGRYGAQ